MVVMYMFMELDMKLDPMKQLKEIFICSEEQLELDRQLNIWLYVLSVAALLNYLSE